MEQLYINTPIHKETPPKLNNIHKRNSKQIMDFSVKHNNKTYR